MFWSCLRRHLTWTKEAINVFTIPEIRGMIARFLKGFFLIKRFSFDLVPQRR